MICIDYFFVEKYDLLVLWIVGSRIGIEVELF